MNWLMAHLISDYLLQPDWMGNNKKEQILPLLVHVLIYSTVVFLLTWWPLWAILVVFLTHALLDGTLWLYGLLMSCGYKRFMEPPLFPWSYIIVDNTLHLVVLFVISLVCGDGQVLGRF